MQKHVNLVDLVKSFPTHILLQNLASIQHSTSLIKFDHLDEKSELGSISNLSTKALEQQKEFFLRETKSLTSQVRLILHCHYEGFALSVPLERDSQFGHTSGKMSGAHVLPFSIRLSSPRKTSLKERDRMAYLSSIRDCIPNSRIRSVRA